MEFEGLPMGLLTNIEKDYETCKAYPLMCINMAIQEEFEDIDSRRRTSPIVDDSIAIKESNPSYDYKRFELIGQGGYGEFYKMKHLTNGKPDGKFYAMKHIKEAGSAEKQAVINDASLIPLLNSKEMI